jgi:hypothetical protein
MGVTDVNSSNQIEAVTVQLPSLLHGDTYMSLIVTGLVSNNPDVHTSRAGDVSVTLEIKTEPGDYYESVPVVIDDDSLAARVLREVEVGVKVVVTARRLAVSTWGTAPRAVVVAQDLKVVPS